MILTGPSGEAIRSSSLASALKCSRNRSIGSGSWVKQVFVPRTGMTVDGWGAQLSMSTGVTNANDADGNYRTYRHGVMVAVVTCDGVDVWNATGTFTAWGNFTKRLGIFSGGSENIPGLPDTVFSELSTSLSVTSASDSDFVQVYTEVASNEDRSLTYTSVYTMTLSLGTTLSALKDDAEELYNKSPSLASLGPSATGVWVFSYDDSDAIQAGYFTYYVAEGQLDIALFFAGNVALDAGWMIDALGLDYRHQTDAISFAGARYWMTGGAWYLQKMIYNAHGNTLSDTNTDQSPMSGQLLLEPDFTKSDWRMHLGTAP